MIATLAAARGSAAPAVWDEAPDNVAFVWKKGDAGDAIARASHVSRLSSHVSRVAALSLEPRGALGRVDDTGRLVLHASNQSPHGLRNALANLLKMPADQVRVIAKDVGGSFGMKSRRAAGIRAGRLGGAQAAAARCAGSPIAPRASSPTSRRARCASRVELGLDATAQVHRAEGCAGTSTSAPMSRAGPAGRSATSAAPPASITSRRCTRHPAS